MIVQRTRCIVSHAGSILLAWLRLATSKSARFGAASPYSIVRNILYVIAVIVSADICVVRSDGTRAVDTCLALLTAGFFCGRGWAGQEAESAARNRPQVNSLKPACMSNDRVWTLVRSILILRLLPHTAV
jgi:hypothetical protein